MIIVTGGAGFIGSCLIRTLNDAGITDIIIADNIASTEKWRNLRNKKYVKYVHKTKLFSELPEYENVTAVIHLGACSSTTERDFDYLWENNVEYSKRLWEYCAERQIPFLYASSAATYGDGSQGFRDDCDIDCLLPLNGYGYSKQCFDQWTLNQAKTAPKQHVGLKFFNVYGPNEYCKGSMASMVFHGYHQIQKDGEIRLFKSYRPDYADGMQLRDFVYVKDVCQVILWFLEHPEVSGLFNIGTGKAQSFSMLAESIFKALGLPASIRYIDMPTTLRPNYQYYTQAEMAKLRAAGYGLPFTELEDGVFDYVKNYLSKNELVY
ncbi:MAG: ADP-glyceromanno-heptose 6-epimerase [Lachnospiraceae bacterium]|nr:ADP-glyceromanno-heptose 6-epimerase [Lachnospiraceae bacterium]